MKLELIARKTSGLMNFGTAINCIDGRAQSPVADWIKLHCNVKYVDMITIPGADKVLSGVGDERVDRIEEDVWLSVNGHSSGIVAVAGHFDCLANPCSADTHKDLIISACERVLSWNMGVRAVGLFVNEYGSADVILDCDAVSRDIKSYL